VNKGIEKEVLVIAPPALADGFRLGGATTVTVADRETFNETVERLVDDRHLGIVAAPEPMLAWLTPRLARRVAETVSPLVVGYPTTTPLEETPPGSARSAAPRPFGYHIKIEM
jgi:vacuolar-type H+-ATPase subunit F/Vma7